MRAVNFIDSHGRAITDIPKGAFVQRLTADRKVSISQHNPDAMAVTYMSSDIPGAVFWVSDGIETTADYGHPIEALDAWQGGEVFKENEP